MGIKPNFIKDLKFVYEHDRCENALSNQFLSDLSKVYRLETDEDLKTDDLLNLGRKLEKIRADVQNKVKIIIKPLQKTDPLFCNVSLYAPMDYGRLEVAHTRTLAWLIDPRKEHEFGESLFHALFPLLTEKANYRPFKIIDVSSEQFHYDNDNDIFGRTDIWIEAIWLKNNKPFLVVIEAKINATEGENQLSRYEEFIKKRNIKECFRVFLTPHGSKPTSAVKNNWHPISFSKVAGRLTFASKKVKNKEGYHFLKLYIASIIRDILGWKVDLKNEKSNPYQLFSYLKQIEGENSL